LVEYPVNSGKMMREVFEPGAFSEIDPGTSHITVNRDHKYERTVGKVVELRHDDPRGAIALTKISNTPLGDETLRLADDGILRASVGAATNRSGFEILNGLRRIFRVALLDHIAMLPNPAYAGATVLGVRSEALSEDVAMPNLESVLSIDGMADLIRGRSAAPWRGKEYHNG
jgi:HK97 family phage prohead protease